MKNVVFVITCSLCNVLHFFNFVVVVSGPTHSQCCVFAKLEIVLLKM